MRSAASAFSRPYVAPVVLLAMVYMLLVHVGFEVLVRVLPIDAGHRAWVTSFHIIKWDSESELTIAESGYYFAYPAWIAKYPGFNLLVRLFHKLTGIPIDWAMMLMHYATNWFGIAELFRLVESQYDRKTANKAIALTIFYAALMGYTWTAVYTEGLYLGLSSLAFLFYFRRHYLLLGIVLAYAVVARPYGAVLCTVLVLGIAYRHRDDYKKALWYCVQAGFYSILTWSYWMAYGSFRVDKFMGPLVLEPVYDGRGSAKFPLYRITWQIRRIFQYPEQWERRLIGVFLFLVLMEMIFLIIFTLRSTPQGRRIKPEFAIYGLLAINIVLVTTQQSVARYSISTALVWGMALPLLDYRMQKLSWVLYIAGVLVGGLLLIFYFTDFYQWMSSIYHLYP